MPISNYLGQNVVHIPCLTLSHLGARQSEPEIVGSDVTLIASTLPLGLPQELLLGQSPQALECEPFSFGMLPLP